MKISSNTKYTHPARVKYNIGDAVEIIPIEDAIDRNTDDITVSIRNFSPKNTKKRVYLTIKKNGTDDYSALPALDLYNNELSGQTGKIVRTDDKDIFRPLKISFDSNPNTTAWMHPIFLRHI